jgi:hypothetical protein
MASFIQRGDTWRAMVARKRKRISATFDTRAEAEQWAIEAEAGILSGMRADLVRRSAGGIRMSDLMERYTAEVSPRKKGRRFEQTRLRALREKFEVFRRPVREVDGPALAEWRDLRLKAVLASTVNRELNLISAMVNTAIKE